MRTPSQKKSSYILSDLLTENTIMLKVPVSNWKDAIVKAGELLVKVGAVEPRYIEAMIKFKQKFGPYIVIAPGIALPHARPEDGVKRTCLSLITLKKPVEFGNKDNDPVDLVIAFGAVDNKQHLNVMAQLANLLSNQNEINKIRNAERKRQVLEVISKL